MCPRAFHVDFWDYLGWRDRCAASAFSDRQRLYAARWQSESVYTPGFVLNGKEWRAWSGRKDAPKSFRTKVGVITISSSDTNHWPVNFAPAVPGGPDYEIHAALLAGDLASDVKAGENRGRRLGHDSAVLTLVNASLPKGGDGANGDFILSAQQKPDVASLALAAWVTASGHLEPLQATGGWLVRPFPGR